MNILPTHPIPVRIPALNLPGTLVGVVPSSTPGGEAKYRIGWNEPAAGNAYREAGFFWADMVVDEEHAVVAKAENGVAA